jgi:hypothetical protein
LTGFKVDGDQVLMYNWRHVTCFTRRYLIIYIATENERYHVVLRPAGLQLQALLEEQGLLCLVLLSSANLQYEYLAISHVPYNLASNPTRNAVDSYPSTGTTRPVIRLDDASIEETAITPDKSARASVLCPATATSSVAAVAATIEASGLLHVPRCSLPVDV